MVRWLRLVAVVLALSGCGAAATAAPTGCVAKDGQPVYKLLETYANSWAAAGDRADRAQGAALATEIESLRAIRNEVNGQQWPACGKAAQAAFVAVIDSSIEGFTAILNQKPKAESNAIFERMREQQAAFKAEVQKLPQ